MFYVSINTFRHHFDGGAGHFGHQALVLRRAAVQKADDLRHVLRLIADAFHVRDHFQGGGDLPQIAGHRLLLQQHFQAHGLDVALLPVDLRIQRGNLSGLFGVARRQRLRDHGDHFFAQRAHFDQFFIQLRQLFVKTASHQPNLPVI